MNDTHDILPNALYEQALDRSMSGVIIYQPIRNDVGEIVDFRYQYMNPQAAEWLAVSVENLTQHVLSELYTADQTLFERYKQVMVTQQPLRFAFEHKPMRGLPLRWFDIQVSPIDDGLVCSFFDITEQKQAELALQQAHRRLNEAQLIGRVGSFEWNLGDKYTFWSDELYRIAGLEPQSVPITIDDTDTFTHPDDQAAVKELQNQSIQTPGWYEQTHRLVRPDGRVRWVNHRFESIADETGQIVRVRGTVQDITEHIETNEQLRQQTELLKGVLNTTLNAIAVYEAKRNEAGQVVDFVIKLFNQAAQQQVRLPPEQIPGKTLLEISPYSKEIGIFNAAVDVVETGISQTVTRDYPYLNKSFQTGISRFGADGLVISSADVSLTRYYQRQAEQYAENLQAVLDASPAAIGFLKTQRDGQAKIEDFCLAVCNQKFAQLVRRPSNELIGQSVSELATLLWGADTLNNLIRVRDTGQPIYEERIEREGTERWLALSVTKQDDGVVVTGLDITDLKQLQRQQESLIEQVRQSAGTVEQLTNLREQVRARGQILRASSHDLRGSLGIIEGAAGLLQLADTDDERSQMLAIIQRNVQETTRLITELLDYSRLESGQQPVQFGSFDGAALLHQLIETARPLARSKGLTIHHSGREPLPVEGDALLVLRLAQTLLHNVLSYSGQGNITVHWGGLGPDEWQFWVANTQSITVEGIGLSIVRQLCDLLQGRLHVESQPDQGTVFRVVLPRHYPKT